MFSSLIYALVWTIIAEANVSFDNIVDTTLREQSRVFDQNDTNIKKSGPIKIDSGQVEFNVASSNNVNKIREKSKDYWKNEAHNKNYIVGYIPDQSLKLENSDVLIPDHEVLHNFNDKEDSFELIALNDKDIKDFFEKDNLDEDDLLNKHLDLASKSGTGGTMKTFTVPKRQPREKVSDAVNNKFNLNEATNKKQGSSTLNSLINFLTPQKKSRSDYNDDDMFELEFFREQPSDFNTYSDVFKPNDASPFIADITKNRHFNKKKPIESLDSIRENPSSYVDNFFTEDELTPNNNQDVTDLNNSNEANKIYGDKNVNENTVTNDNLKNYPGNNDLKKDYAENLIDSFKELISEEQKSDEDYIKMQDGYPIDLPASPLEQDKTLQPHEFIDIVIPDKKCTPDDSCVCKEGGLNDLTATPSSAPSEETDLINGLDNPTITDKDLKDASTAIIETIGIRKATYDIIDKLKHEIKESNVLLDKFKQSDDDNNNKNILNDDTQNTNKNQKEKTRSISSKDLMQIDNYKKELEGISKDLDKDEDSIKAANKELDPLIALLKKLISSNRPRDSDLPEKKKEYQSARNRCIKTKEVFTQLQADVNNDSKRLQKLESNLLLLKKKLLSDSSAHDNEPTSSNNQVDHAPSESVDDIDSSLTSNIGKHTSATDNRLKSLINDLSKLESLFNATVNRYRISRQKAKIVVQRADEMIISMKKTSDGYSYIKKSRKRIGSSLNEFDKLKRSIDTSFIVTRQKIILQLKQPNTPDSKFERLNKQIKLIEMAYNKLRRILDTLQKLLYECNQKINKIQLNDNYEENENSETYIQSTGNHSPSDKHHETSTKPKVSNRQKFKTIANKVIKHKKNKTSVATGIKTDNRDNQLDKDASQGKLTDQGFSNEKYEETAKINSASVNSKQYGSSQQRFKNSANKVITDTQNKLKLNNEGSNRRKEPISKKSQPDSYKLDENEMLDNNVNKINQTNDKSRKNNKYSSDKQSFKDITNKVINENLHNRDDHKFIDSDEGTLKLHKRADKLEPNVLSNQQANNDRQPPLSRPIIIDHDSDVSNRFKDAAYKFISNNKKTRPSANVSGQEGITNEIRPQHEKIGNDLLAGHTNNEAAKLPLDSANKGIAGSLSHKFNGSVNKIVNDKRNQDHYNDIESNNNKDRVKNINSKPEDNADNNNNNDKVPSSLNRNKMFGSGRQQFKDITTKVIADKKAKKHGDSNGESTNTNVGPFLPLKPQDNNLVANSVGTNNNMSVSPNDVREHVGIKPTFKDIAKKVIEANNNSKNISSNAAVIKKPLYNGTNETLNKDLTTDETDLGVKYMNNDKLNDKQRLYAVVNKITSNSKVNNYTVSPNNNVTGATEPTDQKNTKDLPSTVDNDKSIPSSKPMLNGYDSPYNPTKKNQELPSNLIITNDVNNANNKLVSQNTANKLIIGLNANSNTNPTNGQLDNSDMVAKDTPKQNSDRVQPNFNISSTSSSSNVSTTDSTQYKPVNYKDSFIHLLETSPKASSLNYNHRQFLKQFLESPVSWDELSVLLRTIEDRFSHSMKVIKHSDDYFEVMHDKLRGKYSQLHLQQQTIMANKLDDLTSLHEKLSVNVKRCSHMLKSLKKESSKIADTSAKVLGQFKKTTFVALTSFFHLYEAITWQIDDYNNKLKEIDKILLDPNSIKQNITNTHEIKTINVDRFPTNSQVNIIPGSDSKSGMEDHQSDINHLDLTDVFDFTPKIENNIRTITNTNFDINNRLSVTQIAYESLLIELTRNYNRKYAIFHVLINKFINIYGRISQWIAQFDEPVDQFLLLYLDRVNRIYSDQNTLFKNFSLIINVYHEKYKQFTKFFLTNKRATPMLLKLLIKDIETLSKLNSQLDQFDGLFNMMLQVHLYFDNADINKRPSNIQLPRPSNGDSISLNKTHNLELKELHNAIAQYNKWITMIDAIIRNMEDVIKFVDRATYDKNKLLWIDKYINQINSRVYALKHLVNGLKQLYAMLEEFFKRHNDGDVSNLHSNLRKIEKNSTELRKKIKENYVEFFKIHKLLYDLIRIDNAVVSNYSTGIFRKFQTELRSFYDDDYLSYDLVVFTDHNKKYYDFFKVFQQLLDQYLSTIGAFEKLLKFCRTFNPSLVHSNVIVLKFAEYITVINDLILQLEQELLESDSIFHSLNNDIIRLNDTPDNFTFSFDILANFNIISTHVSRIKELLTIVNIHLSRLSSLTSKSSELTDFDIDRTVTTLVNLFAEESSVIQSNKEGNFDRTSTTTVNSINNKNLIMDKNDSELNIVTNKSDNKQDIVSSLSQNKVSSKTVNGSYNYLYRLYYTLLVTYRVYRVKYELLNYQYILFAKQQLLDQIYLDQSVSTLSQIKDEFKSFEVMLTSYRTSLVNLDVNGNPIQLTLLSTANFDYHKLIRSIISTVRKLNLLFLKLETHFRTYGYISEPIDSEGIMPDSSLEDSGNHLSDINGNLPIRDKLATDKDISTIETKQPAINKDMSETTVYKNSHSNNTLNNVTTNPFGKSHQKETETKKDVVQQVINESSKLADKTSSAHSDKDSHDLLKEAREHGKVLITQNTDEGLIKNPSTKYYGISNSDQKYVTQPGPDATIEERINFYNKLDDGCKIINTTEPDQPRQQTSQEYRHDNYNSQIYELPQTENQVRGDDNDRQFNNNIDDDREGKNKYYGIKPENVKCVAKPGPNASVKEKAEFYDKLAQGFKIDNSLDSIPTEGNSYHPYGEREQLDGYIATNTIQEAGSREPKNRYYGIKPDYISYVKRPGPNASVKEMAQFYNKLAQGYRIGDENKLIEHGYLGNDKLSSNDYYNPPSSIQTYNNQASFKGSNKYHNTTSTAEKVTPLIDEGFYVPLKEKVDFDDKLVQDNELVNEKTSVTNNVKDKHYTNNVHQPADLHRTESTSEKHDRKRTDKYLSVQPDHMYYVKHPNPNASVKEKADFYDKIAQGYKVKGGVSNDYNYDKIKREDDKYYGLKPENDNYIVNLGPDASVKEKTDFYNKLSKGYKVLDDVSSLENGNVKKPVGSTLDENVAVKFDDRSGSKLTNVVGNSGVSRNSKNVKLSNNRKRERSDTDMDKSRIDLSNIKDGLSRYDHIYTELVSKIKWYKQRLSKIRQDGPSTHKMDITFSKSTDHIAHDLQELENQLLYFTWSIQQYKQAVSPSVLNKIDYYKLDYFKQNKLRDSMELFADKLLDLSSSIDKQLSRCENSRPDASRLMSNVIDWKRSLKEIAEHDSCGVQSCSTGNSLRPSMIEHITLNKRLVAATVGMTNDITVRLITDNVNLPLQYDTEYLSNSSLSSNLYYLSRLMVELSHWFKSANIIVKLLTTSSASEKARVKSDLLTASRHIEDSQDNLVLFLKALKSHDGDLLSLKPNNRDTLCKSSSLIYDACGLANVILSKLSQRDVHKFSLSAPDCAKISAVVKHEVCDSIMFKSRSYKSNLLNQRDVTMIKSKPVAALQALVLELLRYLTKLSSQFSYINETNVSKADSAALDATIASAGGSSNDAFVDLIDDMMLLNSLTSLSSNSLTKISDSLAVDRIGKMMISNKSPLKSPLTDSTELSDHYDEPLGAILRERPIDSKAAPMSSSSLTSADSTQSKLVEIKDAHVSVRPDVVDIDAIKSVDTKQRVISRYKTNSLYSNDIVDTYNSSNTSTIITKNMKSLWSLVKTLARHDIGYSSALGVTISRVTSSWFDTNDVSTQEASKPSKSFFRKFLDHVSPFKKPTKLYDKLIFRLLDDVLSDCRYDDDLCTIEAVTTKFHGLLQHDNELLETIAVMNGDYICNLFGRNFDEKNRTCLVRDRQMLKYIVSTKSTHSYKKSLYFNVINDQYKPLMC